MHVYSPLRGTLKRPLRNNWDPKVVFSCRQYLKFLPCGFMRWKDHCYLESGHLGGRLTPSLCSWCNLMQDIGLLFRPCYFTSDMGIKKPGRDRMFRTPKGTMYPNAYWRLAHGLFSGTLSPLPSFSLKKKKKKKKKSILLQNNWKSSVFGDGWIWVWFPMLPFIAIGLWTNFVTLPSFDFFKRGKNSHSRVL